MYRLLTIYGDFHLRKTAGEKQHLRPKDAEMLACGSVRGSSAEGHPDDGVIAYLTKLAAS